MPEALKLVPADLAADACRPIRRWKGKVFIKNDAWWADNLEKTLVRFKQWQLA